MHDMEVKEFYEAQESYTANVTSWILRSCYKINFVWQGCFSSY